jgi:hypothetical protein
LALVPFLVISNMSGPQVHNPPAAVEDSGAMEPSTDTAAAIDVDADTPPRPVEIGGRKGPEPTRYGDWEKNGRCIDF